MASRSRNQNTQSETPKGTTAFDLTSLSIKPAQVVLSLTGSSQIPRPSGISAKDWNRFEQYFAKCILRFAEEIKSGEVAPIATEDGQIRFIPGRQAAALREQRISDEKTSEQLKKRIAGSSAGFLPTLEKSTLLAGPGSTELGNRVATFLGTQLGDLQIKTFKDGEFKVTVGNVRKSDVVLIQGTHNPGPDHLFELLTIVDALKASGANDIRVVIPYYGFARQDRQDEERTSITAQLIARLLLKVGANHFIVVDPHSTQMQGFFSGRSVDLLYGSSVLLPYILENFDLKKLKIGGADASSGKRAEAWTRLVGAYPGHEDLVRGTFIMNKHRVKDNSVERMELLGKVRDHDVILLDDMLDTGGTVLAAVKELRKRNVRKIIVCCTHGVCSDGAHKKLEDAEIDAFVTTDTIPQHWPRSKKFHVVPIERLIAEAISRASKGHSIRDLKYTMFPTDPMGELLELSKARREH